MNSQPLKIYWDKLNKNNITSVIDYINTLNDKEIKEFVDETLDSFIELKKNNVIIKEGNHQIRYFIKYLSKRICDIYCIDIKKEKIILADPNIELQKIKE